MSESTCQCRHYQVRFSRLKTLVKGLAPYGTRKAVLSACLTIFCFSGKKSIPFLEVHNIMYAIIKTGGKQYCIEEGSQIRVEKLVAEAGTEVTLNEVLMVGGGELKIGAPFVKDASVTAEVVAQARAPKVLVFKRWRRNDSRKLRGHRQDYTTLKIKSISC